MAENEGDIDLFFVFLILGLEKSSVPESGVFEIAVLCTDGR